MALFIYKSFNQKLLLDLLAELIKKESSDLNQLFENQTIMIQNNGVANWINHELCERLGLSFNIDYELPAQRLFRYFRQLYPDLPNPLPSGIQTLYWHIYHFLMNELDDSYKELNTVYERIQSIDNKEDRTSFCWELAKNLGRNYDEYQLYRPKMLKQWEGITDLSDSENWQAHLWNIIVEQQHIPTRSMLLTECLAKSDELQEAKNLIIYGLPTMPPAYLHILEKVFRNRDIYLFWPYPSAEENKVFKWAKSHQEYLDFIVKLWGVDNTKIINLEAGRIANETTLDKVKSAVLHQRIEDISRHLEPKDISFKVHNCHSRSREVEVAKDIVLNLLEKDPDLSVSDILLTAPNIEEYKSYIEAEFLKVESAESRPIPIQLRDLSHSTIYSAVALFLKLLNVVRSKIDITDVIELIHHPIIKKSLDFDDSDVSELSALIADLKVKWGLNPRHIKAKGYPDKSLNYWKHAIKRLVYGSLIHKESEAEFDEKLLSFQIPLSQQMMKVVASLNVFIEILEDWTAAIHTELTLSEWNSLSVRMMRRLLSEEYDIEKDILAEKISEIEKGQKIVADSLEGDRASNVLDLAFSYSMYVKMIQEQMSRIPEPAGFINGKLICSSLVPMRSIPFKAIVMLGMSEGEFPRANDGNVLNLMHSLTPNFADRNKRKDDSLLFLETVLSAQNYLHITYLGQSVKSNVTYKPSNLILELFKLIGGKEAEEKVVIKHPLQAFSYKYYEQNNVLGWASLNKENYDLAERLMNSQAVSIQDKQPDFKVHQDGNQLLKRINAADLFNFFKHPARYFFKNVYKLDCSFTEHFSPTSWLAGADYLDQYFIRAEWIENLLEQKDLNTFDKWVKKGLYVDDFASRHTYEAQLRKIKAEGISKENLDDTTQLQVSIKVGNTEIEGNYKLYGGHYVQVIPSDKGKHIIPEFVNYLILRTAYDQGKTKLTVPPEFRLYRLDVKKCAIQWNMEDKAIDILELCLELYKQMEHQVPVFIPDLAYDFSKKYLKNKNENLTAEYFRDFIIQKMWTYQSSDYAVNLSLDNYYRLAYTEEILRANREMWDLGVQICSNFIKK